MVFKYKISLVILCLGLLSFAAHAKKIPKKIRKHFTNCYSNKQAAIPIKTEGYYIERALYKKCANCPVDTLSFVRIFYKDGTCVENNSIMSDNESIGFYIKALQNYGNWGIYKVNGDEIITQSILNPGYYIPRFKWGITETRYKVIDSTHIQLISRKSWDGNGDVIGQTGDASQYLPAYFEPLNYLPPPNSWIKDVEGVYCP